MGFFSFNKYPTAEHYLTEEHIKKIVSEVAVQTLKSNEEALVEQAIVARRRGDGKISLQQIYETLKSLVNQKKISKYDRDALMKRFVNHFKTHGL
jgi:hypothetical protein